jgi:hypothetical protein
MSQIREKFVTEVDSEILAAVRALAEKQSCPLEALVDEARADLIEKHKNARPRPHARGAYRASHDKLNSLYKKLTD